MMWINILYTNFYVLYGAVLNDFIAERVNIGVCHSCPYTENGRIRRYDVAENEDYCGFIACQTKQLLFFVSVYNNYVLYLQNLITQTQKPFCNE